MYFIWEYKSFFHFPENHSVVSFMVTALHPTTLFPSRKYAENKIDINGLKFLPLWLEKGWRWNFRVRSVDREANSHVLV